MKYQGNNSLNKLIDLIHTEFGNRETKVSLKDITTSWSNNKQDISVEGVTPNSTVDIVLSEDATEIQAFQYNSLKLRDGGLTTGKVTVECTGDVNSVNIPVYIIVRGD